MPRRFGLGDPIRVDMNLFGNQGASAGLAQSYGTNSLGAIFMEYYDKHKEWAIVMYPETTSRYREPTYNFKLFPSKMLKRATKVTRRAWEEDKNIKRTFKEIWSENRDDVLASLPPLDKDGSFTEFALVEDDELDDDFDEDDEMDEEP